MKLDLPLDFQNSFQTLCSIVFNGKRALECQKKTFLSYFNSERTAENISLTNQNGQTRFVKHRIELSTKKRRKFKREKKL